MSKINKEIMRYVLLLLIMFGGYNLIYSAYVLELKQGLGNNYAAIVDSYLLTWAYVVKWFFNSKINSTDTGLDQSAKEVVRYLLLVTITLAGYNLVTHTFELEELKKLTPAFSSIVTVYLATWGFIIKWFFLTKIEGETVNV